jgi:hypothetical protein
MEQIKWNVSDDGAALKLRIELLKAELRREEFSPAFLAHFHGFIGGLEFAGAMTTDEVSDLVIWAEESRKSRRK